MTDIKLDHINDPEWIALRESQWEEYADNQYTHTSTPKKEIKACRNYFLSGNYTELQKELDDINHNLYVSYFPAKTLEQFKGICKVYWKYWLEEYNPKYKSKLDDNRIFFSNISSDIKNYFFSDALRHEMFFWIYGEHYESTRTIDIGLDNWSPQVEIDARTISSELLLNFYSYLSSEDSDCTAEINMYLTQQMDYLFSAMPNIDKDYFSCQLMPKTENKLIHNRQLFYRKILLYFLGFKASDDKRNDKKLEKQIKERLLDKDNGMPQEYFELIEYLKIHKRKALKK